MLSFKINVFYTNFPFFNFKFMGSSRSRSGLGREGRSKGQGKVLCFLVQCGSSPASVYLTPSSAYEKVCVGVRGGGVPRAELGPSKIDVFILE